MCNPPSGNIFLVIDLSVKNFGNEEFAYSLL